MKTKILASCLSGKTDNQTAIATANKLIAESMRILKPVPCANYEKKTYKMAFAANNEVVLCRVEPS